MLIHDLTADDCAGILTRTHVGHLACAKDGQPYIVPIHFSFDADQRCVYSVATVGQKIEWMRANPRVCLEVEDIADKDHWQTVVLSGTYNELGDAPGDAEARRRCHSLFEQRPEWWLPATAQRPPRELRAVVLYRIRIDRMSGRRAARNVLAPASLSR
jgi:uncharacterized protein